MARYLGLGSDIPLEASERLVAEYLRALSDEWTVLHHVAWQSRRGARQGDGEADFVLLHPKKGILVLEVKGGGIRLENGRWRSEDRFGQLHDIKNPFEQATVSKYALIAWLQSRNLDHLVRVGHCVAFPNLNTVPFLGPAAPREITWAQGDLSNIEIAANRVVQHWSLTSSLSKKDVGDIVALLAPTITASKTIRQTAADTEATLLRLTAEQVETFARLRSARGGLVLGGAGTGKTVLAVARALQLARDGFQTALLCFNELLGQELEQRVGSTPNLYASTYHSLCIRELKRIGTKIPGDLTSSFWEKEAPMMLMEACDTGSTRFDAIIVDEGQDFAPDWFASLESTTGRDSLAPFYVFADPRQDLWQRNWRDANERWPFTYELTQNLRNSRPIAEKVARTIGTPGPTRGADGVEPTWKETRASDTEQAVMAALEQLFDAGFGPKDVVVLCQTRERATRLRERVVGPYSLGSWGGRGVPVETIARFKGLESEAIVLALEKDDDERLKAVGYVGLSRARSVLIVAGSRQNRKMLNWDAPMRQ